MTLCHEVGNVGGLRLPRLAKLLLFFVMQGIATILVGFAALFLSFEPVWSAEGPTFASPGEVRSGSLLLKADGDGTLDATRLGIDVDLTVSGPTVRARVTQIFKNPTQNWVEATYVYPLPEGGAVDTLKMVIGDRVVVGEIKERQQARVDLRAGAAKRAEGGADRAAAAEHLHQRGRQYRSRRNRAGADRVSGAGAPVRRYVLLPRADGGRPAL